MVSSFSESITGFSDFSIGCNIGKWDDDNDKDNGPVKVGQRALHFTAKYLYKNILSYHACETVDLIA